MDAVYLPFQNGRSIGSFEVVADLFGAFWEIVQVIGHCKVFVEDRFQFEFRVNESLHEVLVMVACLSSWPLVSKVFLLIKEANEILEFATVEESKLVPVVIAALKKLHVRP